MGSGLCRSRRWSLWLAGHTAASAHTDRRGVQTRASTANDWCQKEAMLVVVGSMAAALARADAIAAWAGPVSILNACLPLYHRRVEAHATHNGRAARARRVVALRGLDRGAAYVARGAVVVTSTGNGTERRRGKRGLGEASSTYVHHLPLPFYARIRSGKQPRVSKAATLRQPMP